MLVGNSAGFTLLSNEDFWDPKNIQLFEDGQEKSTIKPNMCVKAQILKYSTCKCEVTENWTKIKNNPRKILKENSKRRS